MLDITTSKVVVNFSTPPEPPPPHPQNNLSEVASNQRLARYLPNNGNVVKPIIAQLLCFLWRSKATAKPTDIVVE